MLINVVVQLGPDDEFTMSSTEVADAAFKALKADKDKDFCTATVQQPLSEPGTAGKGPPSETP